MIKNIEDDYNIQINELSKIDKAINDVEHTKSMNGLALE